MYVFGQEPVCTLLQLFFVSCPSIRTIRCAEASKQENTDRIDSRSGRIANYSNFRSFVILSSRETTST